MESRSDFDILFKLNGNYQARLEASKINADCISEQLIERFPSDTLDKPYQITYILGPSSGDIGKLTSPLISNRDKNTSALTTLYYICKDGLDINKAHIPSLKLTCCNVNTYFDGLFDDYVITTYTGPDNCRKVLNDSAVALIFSNDIYEIAAICDEIKSLTGEKPMPVIFIITNEKNKIDINAININIADVSPLSLIHSKKEALEFWQSVREKLDRLTYLSAKLNPGNERSCLMM